MLVGVSTYVPPTGIKFFVSNTILVSQNNKNKYNLQTINKIGKTLYEVGKKSANHVKWLYHHIPPPLNPMSMDGGIDATLPPPPPSGINQAFLRFIFYSLPAPYALVHGILLEMFRNPKE